MGRERKTDATQKDKRREGPISGGTVYIRLSAVPISSQLLDANVQFSFSSYGTAITRSKRLPLSSQSQFPNQNPALYAHVTVTKQSRPFGRPRKKHRKSPSAMAVEYKSTEVYRHIQSQRCLDDFPGAFVCTFDSCLALGILDAHICSFAGQIANEIFSLKSHCSM